MVITLGISLESKVLGHSCRLSGSLPLLLTHIIFIYFLKDNKPF